MRGACNEEDRGLGESIYRVPTQIIFSNSLCFPCVFPVRLQFFPVPIYIICNYYIHKTDLADLSSFWKKNGNFRANYRNILYLWHQGIYNLRKLPVFWQNFQIEGLFTTRELYQEPPPRTHPGYHENVPTQKYAHTLTGLNGLYTSHV